jgi:arylsulfatase A-like enzyme
MLDVPLLVKWPAGTSTPRGGRQEAAQLLDVLPTVLEVAGVPAPEGLEGRSLLRAAPPAPPQGQGALSFLALDGTHLQSVTDGSWKLIRAGRLDAARSGFGLYDIGNGPERKDEAAARPVLAAHLEAQLVSALRRRPAAPLAPQAVMPPEVIERLKALGYLR